MIRNRIGTAWIWWAALIILLLRLSVAQEIEDSPVDSDDSEMVENDDDSFSTMTPAPAKTADQLGVPRCESDYDCVNNGICRKDVDGYGRCLCPLSCPGYIPMSCRYSPSSRALITKKDLTPCLQMDPIYRSKYSLADPLCLKDRCVCPPMFEEVNAPRKFPKKTLLPTKCDKRELQVRGFVDPSESVYKGNDVTLYCCINLDPTGVVDASGVEFIQNTTIVRESTGHPFTEYHHDYQKNYVPSTPCWTMEIKNVQFSDSGSYMCLVTPSSSLLPVVNHTIEFEVKAPRMIKNLNVTANATHANVTWDTEPDATLQIDLRLVRRTDFGGAPIWTSTDAKAPLTIKSLRPATPYTLFITVKDGQTDPFKLTEHFRTKESPPRPPKLEEIRILNSGSGLECEVEWRMPVVSNGRIIKYFVRLQGKIRKGGHDSIVTDDFPAAIDPEKCANYDQSESSERGINPVDFASDFLSCKFGPLRPNRNYTATLWAVNSAGKSNPITFAPQCITNYAEPDEVATPLTVPPTNMTNFRLKFGQQPDDSNGPISCYYVAVVPLLHNVSLDSLPTPDTIVVDSFAKAFSNNMHTSAADKSRYFAYVAESYASFPQETIIGDGNRTNSMEPCKVLYLSRHKSEDSALRPGLKYTGFLIVRVDKDEDIKEDTIGEGKYFPGHTIRRHRGPRKHRQLHMSGPSYAFSPYFKPVYLQPQDEGGSWTTLVLIMGIMLVFAMVGGVSVAYFKFIRGKKLAGEHVPLKMSVYGPVLAENIPGEYRDRHKDSDFMFDQEFQKLPNVHYEASASSKKENAVKNRYNDIKAFDYTRVVLKKLDGDESSDYINANFIKGYDPQKCFIAAQGPLPCTISDFWRMCWEQDVQIIVMVTNLVEKTRNQCGKYWPDDEPLSADNLVVTARGSEYYADYSVRMFDITDVHAPASNRLSPINIAVNQSRSFSDFGESTEIKVDFNSEYANLPNGASNGRIIDPPAANARRIVQYHFTNWNDYRAPECSTGLLRFLHRLRELPEFSSSPVVVHCSAGVGRTGTLVAIDSMLDQYEKEGKVDVFNFVSKMRKQRNLMVQSLEQYTFIYKALAEWHLFGHTDMDEEQLVEHYKMLVEAKGIRDRSASFTTNTRSPWTSATNLVGTGMEEEFKKLDEELESRPTTKFADQPDNIMKNRFPRAVPFDRNRVCLQPLIGYMESSYINASNIKGYLYPYVLAQDPMDESTCFDFWRMIAEQRITFVVMLTPEEEMAPSEKYWPEDDSGSRVFSRNSQNVTVFLREEERTSTHIVRKLEYHMKNEKSRVVYQYCFLCWPGDSPVPVPPDSLLGLVGRVLERQSQQLEPVPIVLHCRNGSSQCGVYCALSALMERLRAEHRVDVLQTVRGLQLQRAEMFTKLEEYAFCYQAVINYLRTFR